MPYVVELKKLEEAVIEMICTNKMFYNKPNEEILKRVHKVQIIGSSFSDPGEDWTRIEILDTEGEVIWSRTISGY